MASTEAATAATPNEPAAPAAPAAAPAEPTAPEPVFAAEPAADPAAPAEPAALAAPEKTYTQADLDRITAKVKKNASYRARKEAEAYYKGLQQGVGFGKPAEQPQSAAEPKEPQRDQFDSYEAYLEARADYRAERKVEEAMARRREADAKSGAAAAQTEAQRRFMQEVEALAKEIPDIRDVLEASDSPLTDPMRDAIQASDAPARIAHFLATNPEEAERIAALPNAKQSLEIGKLDARFATKANSAQPRTVAEAAATARAPSKAPAPITPIGGKVTAGDEMPDPRTQPEKWLEWRNRGLRARMQPGK